MILIWWDLNSFQWFCLDCEAHRVLWDKESEATVHETVFSLVSERPLPLGNRNSVGLGASSLSKYKSKGLWAESNLEHRRSQ